MVASADLGFSVLQLDKEMGATPQELGRTCKLILLLAHPGALNDLA
jgi:hypothetical protein